MLKARTARFIAAVAAFALLAGVSRAAEQRIVFVNMEKCFNEYYKTKLADAQLKTQEDGYNNGLKKLVDDYKAKQDLFNKTREDAENTALNDDARNKKRSDAEELLVEIRDQESAITRYKDLHEKELDDQSRRMRKDIVKEISGVVETYAQAQGYTAVFDSTGQSVNMVPLVLYNDPSADITETIIGMLNKGKPQADETQPPDLRP